MHKIVFKIEPVPASRPRVTRWGTHYLPKYDQFKQDMAKLLMGKRTLYTEPLKLEVTFYHTMPKSWSKKKRDELDGKYAPAVADIDNLEKALYDAMNGVVYEDDMQIVDHHVRKIWVKEDGRIEIIIQRL